VGALQAFRGGSDHCRRKPSSISTLGRQSDLPGRGGRRVQVTIEEKGPGSRHQYESAIGAVEAAKQAGATDIAIVGHGGSMEIMDVVRIPTVRVSGQSSFMRNVTAQIC